MTRSLRSWAWEFLRRCPDYKVSWNLREYESEDWRRRFGLQRPLDPSEPSDDPPFVIGPAQFYEGPAEHTLTLAKNEAAIVVNLLIPLEPQLTLLSARSREVREKYFGGLPRKPNRIIESKYQEYVCALDAHDHARARGLPDSKVISEIASKLFPGLGKTAARDRARDHFEAGDKLRWGGYWILLTRPEKKLSRKFGNKPSKKPSPKLADKASKGGARGRK